MINSRIQAVLMPRIKYRESGCFHDLEYQTVAKHTTIESIVIARPSPPNTARLLLID